MRRQARWIHNFGSHATCILGLIAITCLPCATWAQEAPGIHRMQIRVLDAKGNPIPQVKIFRNHAYKDRTTGRVKIENKNYFTNEQGEATIEFSEISLDLRLWTMKEGYVSLHAMWSKELQLDGDRIPLEFTFNLVEGTKIGGRVIDRNGEPIQGVQVDIRDETALDFHSVGIEEPGLRPVRNYWLTDEQVFTDEDGRWSIENVPPDRLLVFQRQRPGAPRPKIALRFRHSGFEFTEEWGQLQREQSVTLKSLRDQTAAITLKRKKAEP